MVATQQIEINTLYHGSMLSSIPIVSALILPSTEIIVTGAIKRTYSGSVIFILR